MMKFTIIAVVATLLGFGALVANIIVRVAFYPIPLFDGVLLTVCIAAIAGYSAISTYEALMKDKSK